MTFTEWFVFFLAIQVIHFLGTWKLYIKAGRKAWEAAIPIYNGIVLMQIINRPKWWVILLFIPIINLLMFPIVWVETCRSFGFNKRPHTILAVLTLGLFIFYVNYATDAKYIENRSLQPRSGLGEWISSIAFAIIAATLVHTYFMQPYTIPTSSLEKTLLVGDYLFVSKFHYGARVPITPIAAPMVHDTLPAIPIPFTGMNLTPQIPSYLSESNEEKYENSWKNKLSLPYMRLPGFQKIKNNDIVVFSWPTDSLKTMWGDNSGKFTYKPVDKRTNYVKRCVAIAGDSLEIKDGFVFINGKQLELPDRAKTQYFYTLYSKKGITTDKLKRYVPKEFQREYVISFSNQEQARAVSNYGSFEQIEGSKYKITTGDKGIPSEVIKAYNINTSEVPTHQRRVNLTFEEADKLRKDSAVDSLVRSIDPKGIYQEDIFPHNIQYKWSQDNFGPIYIPKKGATVKLDSKSLPFYEQIIKNYENNNLVTFNDKIYINGKEANSYTFKQDYYWMMGDNRQNSLDARYWGYVPFDHVVGKPVLIWFSWDADAVGFMNKLKSIRWNRMFTTVGGNGKLVSYLWLAGLIIASYIGFSFYTSKKKKKS